MLPVQPPDGGEGRAAGEADQHAARDGTGPGAERDDRHEGVELQGPGRDQHRAAGDVARRAAPARGGPGPEHQQDEDDEVAVRALHPEQRRGREQEQQRDRGPRRRARREHGRRRREEGQHLQRAEPPRVAPLEAELRGPEPPRAVAVRPLVRVAVVVLVRVPALGPGLGRGERRDRVREERPHVLDPELLPQAPVRRQRDEADEGQQEDEGRQPVPADGRGGTAHHRPLPPNRNLIRRSANQVMRSSSQPCAKREMFVAP